MSATGVEADRARSERNSWLARLDFDQAPFTIAWEVTRACAYSCMHCRANAQPKRDPDELNTAEAFTLVDQLASFGTNPILVLTGGDPLMRRDLFTIAMHATDRGLRVSLTPTATALLTPKRLQIARTTGIRRVAFSLDGATSETHDRFRGFTGSFQRTMRSLSLTREEGLPIQINTTVCELNVHELEAMATLVEMFNAVQWSVFFLVPTGRGSTLPMLSADEHERVLNWLYDRSKDASFDLKATAAPQYRRIVVERKRAEAQASKSEPAVTGAGFRYADGLNRPTKGVNDGKGFMFISHRGDVSPSGFLPLSAGNVRHENPVDIYRNAPLFRQLRDPSALKGKCGRCKYHEVCGGSRARAYAVSGDYLAADPSCPYMPQ